MGDERRRDACADVRNATGRPVYEHHWLPLGTSARLEGHLRRTCSRFVVVPEKSANGSREFGPLEGEIMEAVWRADRAVSVREIVEALNDGRGEPLAYTTVMTVMNRLANKQALVRSPAGRSYVYEATAADPAGIAVKNVIRTYGDEAMAHFVDEARADPEVWRRMQRMMSED
jgi:predicted transcriptional regulator